MNQKNSPAEAGDGGNVSDDSLADHKPYGILLPDWEGGSPTDQMGIPLDWDNLIAFRAMLNSYLDNTTPEDHERTRRRVFKALHPQMYEQCYPRGSHG